MGKTCSCCTSQVSWQNENLSYNNNTSVNNTINTSAKESGYPVQKMTVNNSSGDLMKGRRIIEKDENVKGECGGGCEGEDRKYTHWDDTEMDILMICANKIRKWYVNYKNYQNYTKNQKPLLKKTEEKLYDEWSKHVLSRFVIPENGDKPFISVLTSILSHREWVDQWYTRFKEDQEKYSSCTGNEHSIWLTNQLLITYSRFEKHSISSITEVSFGTLDIRCQKQGQCLQIININNANIKLVNGTFLNNALMYRWNKVTNVNNINMIGIFDNEFVYTGKYIESTEDTEYTGEFKQGVKTSGILKYKSGWIYEGEFESNKSFKNGKIKFKNGDEYQGGFKDNSFDGIGVYKWKSGYIYKGSYVNGQKQGKGKMIFKNNVMFIGDFNEGKPDGKGWLVIKKSLQKFEGIVEFANGVLVSNNINKKILPNLVHLEQIVEY